VGNGRITMSNKIRVPQRAMCRVLRNEDQAASRVLLLQFVVLLFVQESLIACSLYQCLSYLPRARPHNASSFCLLGRKSVFTNTFCGDKPSPPDFLHMSERSGSFVSTVVTGRASGPPETQFITPTSPVHEKAFFL
jgi:hypothetical protein